MSFTASAFASVSLPLPLLLHVTMRLKLTSWQQTATCKEVVALLVLSICYFVLGFLDEVSSTHTATHFMHYTAHQLFWAGG